MSFDSTGYHSGLAEGQTYTSNPGPAKERRRLPRVDDVAKELRAISARAPVATAVFLYVALNGDWSVRAGTPDPLAPGWTAVGEVPGQNKTGAPRRFRSTDVARVMIDTIKGARVGAPRATEPTFQPPPGLGGPSTDIFNLDEQVQVHTALGRVVGHTVVYSQFGPQRCTLVEFAEPQYVAAWGIHVQVVPIADSMLQRPSPSRRARGSQPPAFRQPQQ